MKSKFGSVCLQVSEFSRRTLVGLLILLMPVIVFAQASSGQSASKPPQVEIAGTQVLHISSSITNKEYDLYINLPRYYSDTTRTFPVLYLIDAQWDFPLVQAIYGEQYYDGFIPGCIMVGITWGGKNPDYDKLRAYDLTPTSPQMTSQYGNAPKFVSFIKKELVPFIESKFRAKNNDRTLIGSSFGGLFTLYTLFNETELFQRYVLTSPSINWDNGVLYTYEENYAEQKKELPVKLFMAVGGYEGVSEFQKYVDLIKSRNYAKLEFESRVLDGMGHSGGKAEGYTRGLQFVFSRPSIRVDAAILDQYVGAYEINPQFKIKMTKDGEQLIAIAPDGSKIPVSAATEKDFYIKGQYLNIHFQKDGAGKVTGFLLQQYGGDTVAKKVE